MYLFDFLTILIWASLMSHWWVKCRRNARLAYQIISLKPLITFYRVGLAFYNKTRYKYLVLGRDWYFPVNNITLALFKIFKRHVVKQKLHARTKFDRKKRKEFQKKMTIRTNTIKGLSTEKWKDLINRRKSVIIKTFHRKVKQSYNQNKYN